MFMIEVTRINRQNKFWVNENLIEFMEETPDTILTMTTGRKVAVAESAKEIAAIAEKNWNVGAIRFAIRKEENDALGKTDSE